MIPTLIVLALIAYLTWGLYATKHAPMVDEKGRWVE